MWTCLKCKENIEDQFDACWSCGTKRDGTPPFKSHPTIPTSASPKPKNERRSEWSAFLRVIGVFCAIVGVVAGVGYKSSFLFFSFVASAIPLFFFAFIADVCTENRYLLKKLLEKKEQDDA